MKVIVIGTNHAGTTAVRTLKRLEPKTEVVTYDKNDVISFLGCGIALWVKGEFENPSGLFYASPEILKSEGIKVNMQHDVIGIDAKKKEITVKNLLTGEQFQDDYDKLIIATGTWPLIPPIPGIDLEGVQICKNYHHAQEIVAANKDSNIKKVAVVGAGYIGVELVDAFISYGKEVTLIDMAPRIMPAYYDKSFTDLMEKRMRDAGVKLVLGAGVSAFTGKDGKVTKVETSTGTIDVDYVIFSAGVKPVTDIFKDAVDLSPRGAIKTNEFMQTSNKDIYAIGDCAEVFNKATNQSVPIQLATTAVRTGIIAAANIIKKNELATPGFTGANGIDVFGFKMASTGVSLDLAKRIGMDVESVSLEDNDRPEFMSTVSKVWFQVIWEKKTRRIVGAQVASEHNHTEVMYMMALAIQKGLTIDELPLVDIFFLPHFNKPYNFITLAGLEALGLNYFKK